MKLIESTKNDNFRRWLSLLEGRGIKKQGQFILSGRKIVPELLKQRPGLFKEIIFSTRHDSEIDPGNIVQAYQLPPHLFNSLDVFGTKFPLLVGEVETLGAADLSAPPMGLEILCPLSDPSNLGALLRSCEAFGASKVILLEESTTPYHPKAIRASSGSSLRVPVFKGPSIKNLSGDFVALDGRGTSLFDFKWPKDVRLLIGEEGLGIPNGIKPVATLKIPIQENVESLNAVVAASVALASYRQSY